jgi:hypothetical protein
MEDKYKGLRERNVNERTKESDNRRLKLLRVEEGQ